MAKTLQGLADEKAEREEAEAGAARWALVSVFLKQEVLGFMRERI